MNNENKITKDFIQKNQDYENGDPKTTIDPKEVEHFSKISQEWWNTEGKFRPLHRLNPARVQYIVEKTASFFQKDLSKEKPFKNLSLLDIGCGGGLLSEPMARLGANVTGADASEENINIARTHAAQNDLKIHYFTKTSEELAFEEHRFDILLNMEVVEHVSDVPLFIKSCANLLKPGGIMFISTINRNWKSFALAIAAAEYILQWLPKGTHHYDKFIKPFELQEEMEKNQLKLINQTGIVYNFMTDDWILSKDMSVNYILMVQKKIIS